MTAKYPVTVTVNGRKVTRDVEPRMTVADFLRDELGLTGTHLGCEHGVCGACTVIVDGVSTRTCIMYAPQLDGSDVRTIESITGEGDELHPVLEAFRECHGLQCGFCTPGMVMTIFEFLSEKEGPSLEETRQAISGNLCRCTGYETIVAAVQLADSNWQRPIAPSGHVPRRDE